MGWGSPRSHRARERKDPSSKSSSSRRKRRVDSSAFSVPDGSRKRWHCDRSVSYARSCSRREERRRSPSHAICRQVPAQLSSRMEERLCSSARGDCSQSRHTSRRVYCNHRERLSSTRRPYSRYSVHSSSRYQRGEESYSSAHIPRRSVSSRRLARGSPRLSRSPYKRLSNNQSGEREECSSWSSLLDSTRLSLPRGGPSEKGVSTAPVREVKEREVMSRYRSHLCGSRVDEGASRGVQTRRDLRRPVQDARQEGSSALRGSWMSSGSLSSWSSHESPHRRTRWALRKAVSSRAAPTPVPTIMDPLSTSGSSPRSQPFHGSCRRTPPLVSDGSSTCRSRPRSAHDRQDSRQEKSWSRRHYGSPPRRSEQSPCRAAPSARSTAFRDSPVLRDRVLSSSTAKTLNSVTSERESPPHYDSRHAYKVKHLAGLRESPPLSSSVPPSKPFQVPAGPIPNKRVGAGPSSRFQDGQSDELHPSYSAQLPSSPGAPPPPCPLPPTLGYCNDTGNHRQQQRTTPTMLIRSPGLRQPFLLSPPLASTATGSCTAPTSGLPFSGRLAPLQRPVLHPRMIPASGVPPLFLSRCCRPSLGSAASILRPLPPPPPPLRRGPLPLVGYPSSLVESGVGSCSARPLAVCVPPLCSPPQAPACLEDGEINESSPSVPDGVHVMLFSPGLLSVPPPPRHPEHIETSSPWLSCQGPQSNQGFRHHRARLPRNSPRVRERLLGAMSLHTPGQASTHESSPAHRDDAWTIDSVTLLPKVLHQLGSGGLLDDTALEFFFRFLHRYVLPPHQRDRLFFFNSYFYAKLVEGGTDARSRHTAVKRWTNRLLSQVIHRQSSTASSLGSVASSHFEGVMPQRFCEAGPNSPLRVHQLPFTEVDLGTDVVRKRYSQDSFSESGPSETRSDQHIEKSEFIWEFDTVVIPLHNTAHHWTLALVCYPYLAIVPPCGSWQPSAQNNSGRTREGTTAKGDRNTGTSSLQEPQLPQAQRPATASGSPHHKGTSPEKLRKKSSTRCTLSEHSSPVRTEPSAANLDGGRRSALESTPENILMVVCSSSDSETDDEPSRKRSSSLRGQNGTAWQSTSVAVDDESEKYEARCARQVERLGGRIPGPAIFHLDSLKDTTGPPSQLKNIIVEYFQEEFRARCPSLYAKGYRVADSDGWIFNPRVSVPSQKNNYDCGVFLVEYLRHLFTVPGRVKTLLYDCAPRNAVGQGERSPEGTPTTGAEKQSGSPEAGDNHETSKPSGWFDQKTVTHRRHCLRQILVYMQRYPNWKHLPLKGNESGSVEELREAHHPLKFLLELFNSTNPSRLSDTAVSQNTAETCCSSPLSSGNEVPALQSEHSTPRSEALLGSPRATCSASDGQGGGSENKSLELSKAENVKRESVQPMDSKNGCIRHLKDQEDQDAPHDSHERPQDDNEDDTIIVESHFLGYDSEADA